MKKLFILFLMFSLFITTNLVATTNCYISAETLSNLLNQTKPDKGVQKILDRTKELPQTGYTPPSYEYRVSINFTRTDPTPSLSPLERMDQLYQTSDHGIIPTTPKGYEFNPPQMNEFSVMDSNKYYRSILDQSATTSPKLNEVYLASGGFNDVYLVHSNPLPEGIVAGTDAHLKWVMEHGEDVIVKKVFKKTDSDGLLQAARMRTRDDAFYQLADSLSQNVTLEGKPFIRVAKSDLMEGTQEFVSGPTVIELRRAEEMLRYPDKVPPSYSSIKKKEDALRILTEAGFVKDGVPDLDEVNKLVSSVEVFYKDSHAVGRELAYQYFPDYTLSNVYREKLDSSVITKGSPPTPEVGIGTKIDRIKKLHTGQDVLLSPQQARAPQKPTPKKKFYGAIGLDFNHGKNVIWSAKEKMFVIIDI